MFGESHLAEVKNREVARYGPDTYAAPSVTSCTPSSVTTVGGTACTLAGAGFSAGVRAVYFGGVIATALAVVSDVSLTCVAPAHAVGAVTIFVRGPGGWGRLENGATYVAPTGTNRVTESGDSRVTEAGDQRVTE